VIERVTIVAKGPFIEPADLPVSAVRPVPRARRWDARAGHDRGRSRATPDRNHAAVHERQQDSCRTLGISLKTLHNKLNRMKEDRRDEPAE
jgi:DNA-binding NtrC family response regulator